jgi:uncharacterized membrane protein
MFEHETIKMKNRIKKFKQMLFEKSLLMNLFIWFAMAFINVLVYEIHPIFDLNENQILYLFSSASQVIAATYGLIITGYIFLRNELDRKVDRDETLEEVVSLLKNEYFGSIIGISLTTLISISLCFLVIISEKITNATLINYVINISVAAILAELISVILFVIKILNPKSLEIASNKLRNITAKEVTNDQGSLEDFLKNFNEIDSILIKYGTANLFPSEILNSESARRKGIPKSKLVHILYQEEKIDLALKNNLINLISFRNSLIHGTNLFVSSQDVEQSEQNLINLKQSLRVG